MTNREPGTIHPEERFWVDHYAWLKKAGYELRPRYRPDWQPSWKRTGKSWHRSPDGAALHYPNLNDATRLSDGSTVMLKRVTKSLHPYESDISRYFSSPAVMSAPENHCVPTYDVLQVPNDPDRVLLVMFYGRHYSDPAFETVAEALDFFRQMFEGMHFMHLHRIAHRDCNSNNIIMDSRELYPDGFHPIFPYSTPDRTGLVQPCYTRTQRPPRYYYIDFGISRRYEPGITRPLELPIIPGDKSVPEFQDILEGRSLGGVPVDPFPTDVYLVGNMIRTKFLEEYRGLNFIKPLIDDMVKDDPELRPQMGQVVSRFTAIGASVGPWKLRSRLVPRSEGWFSRLFGAISHWRTQLRYYLAGVLPPFPPTLARRGVATY